jgi:hypothetical protein
VIAETLEREARAAEQARRAAWRRTVENAENITAFDGKRTSAGAIASQDA